MSEVGGPPLLHRGRPSPPVATAATAVALGSSPELMIFRLVGGRGKRKPALQVQRGEESEENEGSENEHRSALQRRKSAMLIPVAF